MVGRFIVAIIFCALPATGSAQSYSVAVIGDMTYIRTDSDARFFLPRYHNLLATLDSADVAAVVHLGDYTTGPFCGDSVVNERYAEFSRSAHPLIFVLATTTGLTVRAANSTPSNDSKNCAQSSRKAM